MELCNNYQYSYLIRLLIVSANASLGLGTGRTFQTFIMYIRVLKQKKICIYSI